MTECVTPDEIFSREDIEANLGGYADSLKEDREKLEAATCDIDGMPAEDGTLWKDWVVDFLEQCNDGSTDSHRKIVEYVERLEAEAVKANGEGDKERLEILMLMRKFPYPVDVEQVEKSGDEEEKPEATAEPADTSTAEALEEAAKTEKQEAPEKPNKRRMIEGYINELIGGDVQDMLRHSGKWKGTDTPWIDGFIQYLEREVDNKQFGPNLFADFVTKMETQYKAITDHNDTNRKFLKAQYDVMAKVLKLYPKPTNEFGPAVNKALDVWSKIKNFALTFHKEVCEVLGFKKAEVDKGASELSQRSANVAKKKESASEFVGLVAPKEA